MTETERPTRTARNGVDVPTLFATLDAVKASPAIADFQFRAANTWISGTHNRTTIQGFYGAGQEDTSRRSRSSTTPTIRPCSSAPAKARRPSSSCCTRSRRASPPVWRTSPPPAASP